MKNKKKLTPEEIPEFSKIIREMDKSSKRYVDTSLMIAARIEDLLIKRGMTQRDLAKKLFKHEAEISKWMARHQNFSLRTIAKIEIALNGTILTINNK